MEEKEKEYIKKAVDNLGRDLISLCDDLLLDIQEKQPNKKFISDLIITITGNILLNFNVNLIYALKKNFPPLYVDKFIITLANQIMDFFEIQNRKKE
jgi:hypothetical protein